MAPDPPARPEREGGAWEMVPKDGCSQSMSRARLWEWMDHDMNRGGRP